MKSFTEFIVKLEKPLNKTFKTENGTELHAHQDFSVDRLSNRIAKVISAPLYFESPVKAGYEVMIEPTILYKQIYRGVKQGYTSLIDKDDMLFKLTPNMIILYRENDKDTWKGHLNNLMVTQITEEEPIIKTSLILPKNSKPKYKKGKAKVVYPNDWLLEKGIKAGDELFIDPMGGVNFWLDGKHHWWIRSTDVFGLDTKKIAS